MPDRHRRGPGPSLCERIAAQLRKQNVPVLYLADTLRAHMGEALLYPRDSTHWNALGAFYGRSAIVHELGRQCGIDCPPPATVTHHLVPCTRELLTMAEGLRSTQGMWAAPDVMPGVFAARKLPPTVWYGDSFTSEIMKDVLHSQFTSITFLSIGSEPMNSTLAQHLPGTKLVVLAVGERNVRNYFLVCPQFFPVPLPKAVTASPS